MSQTIKASYYTKRDLSGIIELVSKAAFQFIARQNRYTSHRHFYKEGVPFHFNTILLSKEYLDWEKFSMYKLIDWEDNMMIFYKKWNLYKLLGNPALKLTVANVSNFTDFAPKPVLQNRKRIWKDLFSTEMDDKSIDYVLYIIEQRSYHSGFYL